MKEFDGWIKELHYSDTLEISAGYDVWHDVTELLSVQHKALKKFKERYPKVLTGEAAMDFAEEFKEKYDAS